MSGALGRLAAVVVVLAATACTTPAARDDSTSAGPALDWQDCAPFATGAAAREAFTDEFRCARLSVPLDYDDPNGTMITVAVLRHEATDPANRLGSLVVNPGGPGGSGMLAAAAMAGDQAPENDLTRRFDIVGFDPRGLGASEPRVICFTDEEADRLRADPPLTDPVAIDRLGAEVADKCARRSAPGLLAHSGTREVARDMDALRAALGDEKLTYLGYSYGTRLGTTYAEQFPDKVRAMVLDGALDLAEDALADATGYATGFGGAFAAFAAWCAIQSRCAVGADPAAAPQRLRDLLAPLLTAPLPAGDRTLSYTDAALAVNVLLYDESEWTQLDRHLTSVTSGSGAGLLPVADHDYGRDPDGHYDWSHGVAVLCADYPPVTDPTTITKLIEDPAGGGLPRHLWLPVCANWPEPNTSTPHRPEVNGLPPVLVVSTTGDPATPHDNGVALAAALGGRLLTVEATQHTAFLTDIGNCVDTPTIAYLTDLTLPAEDTHCRQ